MRQDSRSFLKNKEAERWIAVENMGLGMEHQAPVAVQFSKSSRHI
jgi:hypothetical protein